VSDCCLTPNEQYEELDISKNSGKPYKNTNFDNEDIKATRRKENGCVYGHIFLALKTSMSISSDSEKIFDII
jgi:hypothetical protein